MDQWDTIAGPYYSATTVAFLGLGILGEGGLQYINNHPLVIRINMCLVGF
jgi:hypothetical protein